MNAALHQRVADCRAVLFDFAGTLFDEQSLRPAMLENLRWLASARGLSMSDKELRAAYKRGLREAYLQYMSKTAYRHDTFFGDCYRYGFYDVDAPVDEALIAEAVARQNYNTATKLVLRPDCIATLDTLRQAGKHVQIVSNFDEQPLVAALENCGVMNRVDGWTSSESATSCKPDTLIFRVALDKAGCDAAEAIYVGDAPMHDVAGANAAGMISVLLDPAARHLDIAQAEWRPDFRIESLAALCGERLGATV